MLHRKLRGCRPHGRVEIGLYGKIIRRQKSKEMRNKHRLKRIRSRLQRRLLQPILKIPKGKAKCEVNACQALKTLSDGEEVELRCGCKAHVVAEVCKAGINGTEMKTTIG